MKIVLVGEKPKSCTECKSLCVRPEGECKLILQADYDKQVKLQLLAELEKWIEKNSFSIARIDVVEKEDLQYKIKELKDGT